MRTLILPFVLSLLLCCAQAVEIIPGQLSYDPPEFFEGHGPSSANPGVIREYLAKGNTYDNHRQLSFGMIPTDGEGGEGGMPDVAVLKKKLRTMLGSPRVRNLSEVGETVIGGKKALKVSYEVLMEGHPAKAVFTFELYWIPTPENRVIQVSLSATPASALDSIRDSLKSVVVKDFPKADPNAPLPASQDKVSLGAVRADVYEACGKPLAAGPYYDIYFMEPFVTMVSYRMPNVESIYYHRPSDAKKLVKAYEKFDGETIAVQSAPLKPEDIKTLLDRHGPAGNTWKAAGENRWERADGAVAFHWVKRNALVMATKEAWAKMVFPDS
jgi:hypothetical protein